MQQDPNKSQEELLKEFESLSKEITNKPDEIVENLDDSSDVIKFIIKTNIKIGTDKIRTTYLFRLFKTYFKNEVLKDEFIRIMRNFVAINNNFVRIDRSQFSGILPEQFFIEKAKKKIVKTKTYDYSKFVEIFLYENKIKSGPNKIPSTYLYLIFKKWIKDRVNLNPPRTGIFLLLKNKLARKITKNGTFYMITVNETNEKYFKDEYVKKFKKRAKEAHKKRKKNSKKLNQSTQERNLSSFESESKSQN